MAVELNIVLSAELSGRKAIRLSWTAEQNANFEIFWKSNIPAGQEYVLLASTNAFEYITADLEPTKIYQFYVRGWIGEQFFISNAVELFVSCGKGVVLTGGETDEPPCQLAVIGRCRMADMSNPVTGQVSNFIQDPVDKNSFYFLESFGSGAFDYRLWKFTWPSTSTLIATITDTEGNVNSIIPIIAYNPSSGAYHYAFKTASAGDFVSISSIIDVNLTTGAISKGTIPVSLTFITWDGAQIFSYISGVNLWFAITAMHIQVFSPTNYMFKKLAGSTTVEYHQINAGTAGGGTWCKLKAQGRQLSVAGSYYDCDFNTMSASTPPSISTPTISDTIGGGIPMNVIDDGDLRFRFIPGTTNRYFCCYDTDSGTFLLTSVQTLAEGSYTSRMYDIYKKTNYRLMAYVLGLSSRTLRVSRMIISPSIVIYGTRSINIDTGAEPNIRNAHFAYPYVYVYHESGDLGQCVTKICNGVG